MTLKPRTRKLRLGTRGSMLARMQSQWVANQLVQLHPGLVVELEILKTTGDKVLDRPLHELGGKGLFTKELEQALLDRQVDFAVHSFKDVPVTMPLVDVSSLSIVCVPAREDPRDALITRDGLPDISSLPKQARIGTGSLRRRAQLLEARPDLRIEPVRGNIDTRLRKLREGQFDAVIVALAGMKRSGLFDEKIMKPIDPALLLPAPAQGALALQCRGDDEATKGILSALNHADSFLAAQAERQIVQALNGDCHSPIAALATLHDNELILHCAVGHRGGNPPVVRTRQSGPASAWRETVNRTMRILESEGVGEMLNTRA